MAAGSGAREPGHQVSRRGPFVSIGSRAPGGHQTSGAPILHAGGGLAWRPAGRARRPIVARSGRRPMKSKPNYLKEPAGRLAPSLIEWLAGASGLGAPVAPLASRSLANPVSGQHNRPDAAQRRHGKARGPTISVRRRRPGARAPGRPNSWMAARWPLLGAIVSTPGAFASGTKRERAGAAWRPFGARLAPTWRPLSAPTCCAPAFTANWPIACARRPPGAPGNAPASGGRRPRAG